MIQNLRDAQVKNGGILGADATPVSFGNDSVARQAAHTGVAIYDRTHWGRIQVSGADRLRFLHNQSTNDLQQLKPDEGCDTVFVTSTARTIDLATAYALDESVLLLVSPNRRQQLLAWLDKYIFPADRVALQDLTDTTATFSLLGSASSDLLKQWGINLATDATLASHQQVTLAGVPVRVAVGSGLAISGYTLIMKIADATTVWTALVEQGAVPLGDRAWEQLRIEQGRPVPDQELTEDYNALEAGLWTAISFNKGCYIGQETIARLDTYKGVKQQLWGIKLAEIAPANTPVTIGNEKIGVLTSAIATDQGAIALAYIRSKAGGPGLKVQIGNTEGEVIYPPFVTHRQYEPSQSSEAG